jgi:hypothetical protein
MKSIDSFTNVAESGGALEQGRKSGTDLGGVELPESFYTWKSLEADSSVSILIKPAALE